MRYAFCLLFCLLSIVEVQAQPPDPAPTIQDEEPQHTQTPLSVVGTFVWFIQSKQFHAARQCIDFSKPDNEEADNEALEKVASELMQAQGTAIFRITEIEVERNNKDATANVAVHLMNHMGMGATWHELLRLRQVKTAERQVWKLVPSEPRVILQNGSDGYLQRIVTYIAYPKRMLALQSQRNSAIQVKQLTLAVQQFVQDYDEKFDFSPETMREKLKPYLKDEQLWTAPGDEAGTQSYSFNSILYGLSLSKLKFWDTTVLFYSGRDQNLDFRFDGKAIVGFMDGNVEFVDKEQAKNLRWEP